MLFHKKHNDIERKLPQTQWKLIYKKFCKNRLAVLGVIVIASLYFLAFFSDFIAPYHPRTIDSGHINLPPQLPRFIDGQGKFHLRPFVYGVERKFNPETFEYSFMKVEEEKYPIHFFVKTEEYKFLNIIPMSRRLFGVESPGQIHLFGTDRNGRDLFSRTLSAARISLTVGLVGVVITLVLGSFIGILSGYLGGVFDYLIQRLIELFLSFPDIPLWLALSTMLPRDWSPLIIFFCITLILSIINWGGLARKLRGKVLGIKEQEYVLAAQTFGAGTFHIVRRHLLPNTASQIIVEATLALPRMIIGETALSFLGLGIRPPMTSWGVLLQEAQFVRVLLQTPWIIIPAFFVIVAVLGFNFIGDGLRDAADPYSN